ncbi:MAG: hypothetical protein WCO56_17170 [Verrucomicrobiota bacterium]
MQVQVVENVGPKKRGVKNIFKKRLRCFEKGSKYVLVRLIQNEVTAKTTAKKK